MKYLPYAGLYFKPITTRSSFFGLEINYSTQLIRLSNQREYHSYTDNIPLAFGLGY